VELLAIETADGSFLNVLSVSDNNTDIGILRIEKEMLCSFLQVTPENLEAVLPCSLQVVKKGDQVVHLSH